MNPTSPLFSGFSLNPKTIRKNRQEQVRASRNSKIQAQLPPEVASKVNPDLTGKAQSRGRRGPRQLPFYAIPYVGPFFAIGFTVKDAMERKHLEKKINTIQEAVNRNADDDTALPYGAIKKRFLTEEGARKSVEKWHQARQVDFVFCVDDDDTVSINANINMPLLAEHRVQHRMEPVPFWSGKNKILVYAATNKEAVELAKLSLTDLNLKKQSKLEQAALSSSSSPTSAGYSLLPLD